jgi:protocatechuate 3,4-dioxygenase beta subunit
MAGRVESGGMPVTNARVALVFWTGRSGMHVQDLAQTTGPGAFEIPALPAGRRYSIHVSAPGFGQKSRDSIAGTESAGRIELGPFELMPANLVLAGRLLDIDGNAVAGASVNLFGREQPSAVARTDGEGRFEFKQVCEGSAQLYASVGNGMVNSTVQGGDTNVTLQLGQASAPAFAGGLAKKLAGLITDPEGNPVRGAHIMALPGDARTRTSSNGTYSLQWSIPSWQLDSGGDPVLVVRDLAGDRAAAETVPVDATVLDVRLSRAATLVGRVENPAGAPLTNAEVGIWLLAGRTYSELTEQPAVTRPDGTFQIGTIPADMEYVVFARARNHGRVQMNVEVTSETNQIQLEPFVLKPADQVLSGVVVDENGKPAANAHVSLSGDGQPDGSVSTDSKGRFTFKVCEGSVRLFGNADNAYGNMVADAGDTNVVLQIGSSGIAQSVTAHIDLKGRPLRDLAGFGLPAGIHARGRPLLLCLLDIEQRPSRYAARTLAGRAAAVTAKGIDMAAIQATLIDMDSWQIWTNSSAMPFPMGRVQDTSPETKWAGQVPALPWLVLCDADGRVVEEGFSLDELEGKLDALRK